MIEANSDVVESYVRSELQLRSVPRPVFDANPKKEGENLFTEGPLLLLLLLLITLIYAARLCRELYNMRRNYLHDCYTK